MKVLFCNKFFYIKGGAERVFFQERDFMFRQGFQVSDFSMKDPKNLPSKYSRYFIPNIEYNNCRRLPEKLATGINFIHSSSAIRNIKRLIENERPDIDHLHNIYHQMTPSIIPVLKRYGVKIIMTLHDLKLVCPAYLMFAGDEVCEACKEGNYFKTMITHCQGSFIKEALLCVEALFHKYKGSYDYVDRFICPSRFLKSQVSRRINKARLIVLHNGVNTEDYGPIFEDESYALIFGRLSKEKGVGTALKAHAMLGYEFPIKVVGEGPMRAELQARYPRAEFLGFQKGWKLNSIIRNASFVIIPSECYENCSMTALEAMAFGKPIIASRMGGIPEQIDDERTGLLFKAGSVRIMADHMKRLWRDPTLRLQMGRAARLKAEQEYSLKDHCRKLLKIYEDLLNQNSVVVKSKCYI